MADPRELTMEMEAHEDNDTWHDPRDPILYLTAILQVVFKASQA